MKATFPLKDGDLIETRNGTELVFGEVKPKHDVEGGVCWTRQGNWYGRRDGEEMTGWNGVVMTARTFWKLRREGRLP